VCTKLAQTILLPSAKTRKPSHNSILHKAKNSYIRKKFPSVRSQELRLQWVEAFGSAICFSYNDIPAKGSSHSKNDLEPVSPFNIFSFRNTLSSKVIWRLSQSSYSDTENIMYFWLCLWQKKVAQTPHFLKSSNFVWKLIHKFLDNSAGKHRHIDKQLEKIGTKFITSLLWEDNNKNYTK